MAKTMRQARKDAGLKQCDIARMMGVTASAVCHWERGTADISVRKLDEFCRIVGVKRGDIILQ